MHLDGATYHDLTMHFRDRTEPKGLDWSNLPNPYKDYPGLPFTALPPPSRWPPRTLGEVFSRKPIRRPGPPCDIETLSRILSMTYSHTARIRHALGEHHFRSVPSAGALYPCELYLIASGVDGLRDGLYHYSPRGFGLTLLRETKASPPSTKNRFGLLFFITVILFRSCWKYGPRAYRYHLLDTGHLLEALTLSLRAEGLSFSPTYDFDDRWANELLCVDHRKEVCMAMVGTGGFAATNPVPPPLEPPAVDLAVHSITAPHERIPDEVAAAYEGTAQIKPPPAIDTSTSPCEVIGLAVPAGGRIAFPDEVSNPNAFAQVIAQRRSRRNFSSQPVPFDTALELLRLVGSLPMSPSPAPYLCLAIGTATRTVDRSDMYVLDLEAHTLIPLARGYQREEMARACLEQQWVGRASIHFLFLSDINEAQRRWGPRAYRHAHIASGRIGHRVYLASTALGLGCCGVGAFFDEEAHRALGLQGQGRLLYLVASGRLHGQAHHHG